MGNVRKSRRDQSRLLGAKLRPIDSDCILHEVSTLADPAVSPDGRSVAYMVASLRLGDERNTARIAMWASESTPRWLTAGPADSRPVWSPDGRRLAFLRRLTDGLAQVWLLPVDGGEARQLTSLDRGVVELTWSPDGLTLVVVGEVGPDAPPADRTSGPVGEVVDSLYFRGDTIGWRNGIFRHLFRVDVATGKHEQLTRGEYDHMTPVFSRDGNTLAFASTRSRRRAEQRPFGFELCVMSAAGGRVRRLTPESAQVGGICWSADDRHLAAVVAASDAFWQPYVQRIEVTSGESHRLTDDSVLPQTGFFPVVAPPPLVWANGRVHFVADAKAASGVYAVDVTGHLAALRNRRENITGFSGSADGQHLAIVSSDPATPNELVRLDLGRGRSSQTKTHHDLLASRKPGATEWFNIKRAGLRIDCGLVLPPDFNRNDVYPCVLDVHGGPQSFFAAGFNPLHQILAAAGYIVLFTNPRGSTSYGEPFAREVVGDWGGEDYLDVMAAVDRACERSYIDPERLAIHGYSYGGYMAAWAISRTGRFKAAVVGAPVTNLVSMYGTTDIGVSWGRQHWGGPPMENIEWYLERSPLTWAYRVKTPVLLLHGESDYRCPIGQSEEYLVALKERGKVVEMVRFPGSSHLFPRIGHPRLRREYQQRVLAWLARWLPPRFS